jgi:hypothetical protein
MVNLKKVWINQVYYSTQSRLEILKRRDPAEYRRTPFVEENRKRWEIFLKCNLQKSRLRLLTADVKVCRDDSIENLISIWTENAAKLTKIFFKLRSFEYCMCCRQTKQLTRAHLLHDRPELLRRAILEAPIIDDGHECHLSSKWFLRRYLQLHIDFPIAPLCKGCHEYIDRKTST